MRLLRLFPALVSLSVCVPAALGQCAPVHLTSEQDHQRTMDLLHIQSLRPPKSGDPKAPNAANFDEAKAGPFSKPPDPLMLNNGKPVTTSKMWWKQRRPEIVAAYEEEVLGKMPQDVPPVRWEVISTTMEKNGDVPVVTKKLVGHVDNSGCPAITVDIQLTLSTPSNAKGPVPVIMELDLSPEVMAMLAKRFPNLFKPTAGPTWQQQVLAKGWGYASYIPVSVQPDSGAGLTEGIIGLVNTGQPRSVDDWGVLRAWAWGASRALDYFETDKAVDAKHVGIAGHSRYGKASLVAMAFDPRFAIGYISSSGESGAKLYRHIFGETVENQAGVDAYHWVDGNFLKYAGPLTTDDLPVDTNELIALCAPRPVFISGGAATAGGDGWVDPKGMFLAAVGADPVYRLLGAKGLGTTTFPPILTGVTSGALAFREHDQGHTPMPNWPYFLDWATRYL
jgi:(4-O-methyl)-D-glucuronate---lignin esterase